MIKITDEIKEKLPAFKIGVIEYDDITISETPKMIKGRLQFFEQSLQFELETKAISDYPSLKEWRTIFKQIGTDPNKYRPSSEALYRRVKKGNSIISDNSAIDINNFFSLQYAIPFGIYNMETVKEPILISIGDESSQYDALNGRLVNMAEKLVTSDAVGPFGSPIVDSKRTMITPTTKRALQIIYFTPSMSSENAMEMLRAVEKMFIQVHGGQVIKSEVIES
jgi:DNA/RNA-binding domain of Phe-tRNA-synthetase-like protein